MQLFKVAFLSKSLLRAMARIISNILRKQQPDCQQSF
jgi:hypothetical protein